MATYPGSPPLPPLRPDNLPPSKYYIHVGHGEFFRADLIQGVQMIKTDGREIRQEGAYSVPTCKIYVQEASGIKGYDGYLPVDEIMASLDSTLAEILGAGNATE